MSATAFFALIRDIDSHYYGADSDGYPVAYGDIRGNGASGKSNGNLAAIAATVMGWFRDFISRLRVYDHVWIFVLVFL